MSVSDPIPNPSDLPTVRQAVTGDLNQVIGQVSGGIVINQLTIHERVPAAIAPLPVAVASPLTQQEYRQRQVLLNKVKDYWVKGVLKTSLHTRAMIELGLQERPDLVQRPFQDVAEFPDSSGQALPDGTSATNVFDQMEAGRTLLILGKPGSGKTITLLKLSEDLISRTEEDLSQPIPVVFNLSSWARKTQTIAQWLVQELLEKYQVSKALGKTWVETEALILLLDGLDEVKAEQRNACVQALNQFMQTHGTTELVICCRVKDYQALADRLMLRSAICIQPLTSDQIDQYFEQAGEQLASLKEVLRQDEELQGLATSPLILSIMSLAYQGSNQKDIIQGGRPENYRQRLFDTYIDRMFQRRGTTQQYARQKTQHWLIWLAQRMTAAAQTVFLIERLQPSCFLGNRENLLYRLVSGLTSGLICGFFIGLILCLSSALSFWSNGGFSDIGSIPSEFRNTFSHNLSYAISYGVTVGLSSGLMFALFFGLILGSLGEIKPAETLKWSLRATKDSFCVGLIIGLSVGLIVGMIVGLRDGLLILIFNYGLIGGLIGGSVNGLVGGFRGSEILQREIPNQGIWQSVQHAIVLGMFFGLIFGLIFKMNLASSLTFGAIVALVSGGSACIRHLALRLMLYGLGYSPWNYARFLDYATDRLFLQKVGGGYIFVHRMLLEHFAAMPLEQERH